METLVSRQKFIFAACKIEDLHRNLLPTDTRIKLLMQQSLFRLVQFNPVGALSSESISASCRHSIDKVGVSPS